MSSVPLGSDSEVARAASAQSQSCQRGKGIKVEGSLPICSSKGFAENQPAMLFCPRWCLFEVTPLPSLVDVQGL